MNYIVCGNKWWSRHVFNVILSKLDGEWHYISKQSELDIVKIKEMKPRYIFFLHWSWRVPQAITDSFECINFHMTDLPYGRGGSPLQNLILAGKKETMLTAYRMTKEIDAGEVYLKEPLPISIGSAERIYLLTAIKAADMIKHIILESIIPKPQEGEVVTFRRRKPEESVMPFEFDRLYDFIRMLDADTYPKAFIEYGNYRIEFYHVGNPNGKNLIAKVSITKNDAGSMLIVVKRS